VKGLARGGAVVSRPGTRVDGNSPPRARGLVLQVSKHGVAGSRGQVGRVFMICKYCNMQSVNDEIFMFRLKINHAWDKLATCVYVLGSILMVAKQSPIPSKF
jgi:hypothetical protein